MIIDLNWSALFGSMHEGEDGAIYQTVDCHVATPAELDRTLEVTGGTCPYKLEVRVPVSRTDDAIEFDISLSSDDEIELASFILSKNDALSLARFLLFALQQEEEQTTSQP